MCQGHDQRVTANQMSRGCHTRIVSFTHFAVKEITIFIIINTPGANRIHILEKHLGKISKFW